MPAKVEQKNGTDGRRRNRKNGKENFLLLKILGKLKDEASSLISPLSFPSSLTAGREKSSLTVNLSQGEKSFFSFRKVGERRRKAKFRQTGGGREITALEIPWNGKGEGEEEDLIRACIPDLTFTVSRTLPFSAVVTRNKPAPALSA